MRFLTAAFSSLSAVDKDTTCCFLVRTFKQCPPLMITPADTNRRVALSPPQSASEYASSSPLYCKWKKLFAFGFPAKYHPILLTRIMLRTDGFAIAQHTCIAANFRWSMWQVTDACSVLRDHTTCECLTVVRVVTFAIYHLHSVLVVTITRVIPIVFGLALFLTLRPSLPALFPLFSSMVAWSRCVIRLFQLKILQYLPDTSLIRLDRDAIATPLDDTIQDSNSRSASSPITCFLISYFLDIIFMRHSTAHRSPPILMSSPCRVATTCSALMQPCHTHGHAIPLVNFEVPEWRCKLFLPILCGVARAVQAVLQQPAHVSITCLVIF